MMVNFDKAIKIIMAEPPELHYPAYFADLLRKADVPDKDVGDLISRQAAIDEVKRLHDVAWENWKETRISANTMIDALKDLPSAQPEILACGEGELNVLYKDDRDLISRQAAIEARDNE